MCENTYIGTPSATIRGLPRCHANPPTSATITGQHNIMLNVMRNTPASIRNVGGFLNSLKSARDSIARCTNLIRASLNPNLYSSTFKGIFLRENTGFSHGTPEREALPVTTASPQFAPLPPNEHHL